MYKLIGKINLHNSMVNNNLVNFNIFSKKYRNACLIKYLIKSLNLIVQTG